MKNLILALTLAVSASTALAQSKKLDLYQPPTFTQITIEDFQSILPAYPGYKFITLENEPNFNVTFVTVADHDHSDKHYSIINSGFSYAVQTLCNPTLNMITREMDKHNKVSCYR